jgi:hypothetical protein
MTSFSTTSSPLWDTTHTNLSITTTKCYDSIVSMVDAQSSDSYRYTHPEEAYEGQMHDNRDRQMTGQW